MRKLLIVLICLISIGFQESSFNYFQDYYYTYKNMDFSNRKIEIIDISKSIKLKKIVLSEEEEKLKNNTKSSTYYAKKWNSNNIYYYDMYDKYSASSEICNLEIKNTGYVYYPYKGNGKIRFGDVSKSKYGGRNSSYYTSLSCFKIGAKNEDERWNQLFVFLNEMYYDDNFIKAGEDYEEYRMLHKVGNTFYIFGTKNIGVQSGSVGHPVASSNFVVELNFVEKKLNLISFGDLNIFNKPLYSDTVAFDISYNHRYLYFTGVGKKHQNVSESFFKLFLKEVPEKFINGFFCYDIYERKLYILSKNQNAYNIVLDEDMLYFSEKIDINLIWYKAKTPFYTNGYKEGPKFIK